MDENQNIGSIFDEIMTQGGDFGGNGSEMIEDTAAIPQGEELPADSEMPPAEMQEDSDVSQSQPQNAGTNQPDVNTIMQMMNDIMLRQKAEIDQLRQKAEQSGQALQQQSESAQGAIEEELLPLAGTLQPPTIDMAQMRYADDEELAGMSQRFGVQMGDYLGSLIKRELAPMMENYRQMETQAAEEAARNKLSELPRFGDNATQMEHIIKQTPELASMNPDTRYKIAYLMSEGLKVLNAPPAERGINDLVNEVMTNPDALRAIQTRQAQETARTNQGLPQFSGSAGLSSAPANVPKKPESMEEAWGQAYDEFGGGYFSH